MKKINFFLLCFFFSCLMPACFAMECGLQGDNPCAESPTDEEIARLQLQYLCIKMSANHNNSILFPSAQPTMEFGLERDSTIPDGELPTLQPLSMQGTPNTPDYFKQELKSYPLKRQLIRLESLSSSLESEDDPTSSPTQQKQKPQIILPKLSSVFQQTNTSEIVNQNAGFENWLDDIPTNFRPLINEEIIIATEKYLSKNLNASPDFFIALPYDSLVKTVLCLLFYLKYCTYAEFFGSNRNGIITFISKPLSSLKDAIYLYIKNNYLYEIFNAVKYWHEESPGVVSFIQLTTRIIYDYEQESKSNSDPKDKKTLTKYKRILQRFKTTLGNSINFIKAIFKIKIHKLDLSGNNLGSIPQSVFLINELQELILHKNRIMVVMKDIKNLQKLQTLDLQNNNLQMLPKELLDLPNLKEIDLRGNPGLKYHDQAQEIIKALIAKGINIKYDNN